MPVRSNQRKRKLTRKIQSRPLLEADRNFTVAEAALACGVAEITIWRALESGNLLSFRVGRRVILNGGKHLLPWLEAGGRTGRGAEGGSV